MSSLFAKNHPSLNNDNILIMKIDILLTTHVVMISVGGWDGKTDRNSRRFSKEYVASK